MTAVARFSIHGKAIIVTGCASGIGRAAARLFSEAGARLMLADTAEAGAAVADEIVAAGGTARFQRCDVTREEEVETMVAAAVAEFGRLDGAFNNAGIGSPVTLTADFPLETFEHIIRVDLIGPFLCMKHEISAMLRTGGGAIVNTASGLGLVAQAGASPYCAAKAGVLGLTKVAAIEYARRGIRVNAVLPGLVNTAMLSGATEEMLQAARSMHPIGRIAEPDEIAAAALFLLSDAASFVTGSAMSVDGGYVAV